MTCTGWTTASHNGLSVSTNIPKGCRPDPRSLEDNRTSRRPHAGNGRKAAYHRTSTARRRALDGPAQSTKNEATFHHEIRSRSTREQAQWIHDNPNAEVVLQAIRIGGLGITAIANEVYGITGLKLKRQSPLETTFNFELANGGEGYIPPPEQHRLGGYTTWPARSAGLVERRSRLIVETLLELLESVSGKQS